MPRGNGRAGPFLAPCRARAYTGAVKERSEGTTLVFVPSGDLGEAECARVEALAAERKAKAAVLDLSEATYLSSQGVGILLALQSRLAALKCLLILAAPTPLVRRILHQAGLAGLLPVHPTLEAALASTSGR